jgi:7-cyano-7-deazaguanosine (preQ0) biosynthesis protein QueE
MMSGILSVSEIFGPTIQGEGPTQGRATMFLRLGLCNLDCSWCDTPYTWDWTGKNGIKFDREKELVRMPIRDVASQIISEAKSARRLVISGGEPLLQKAALDELVDLMISEGFEIEIETNGTLIASPRLLARVQINVSPKLSNSGIDRDKRINLGTLETLLSHGATLKFVVTSEADLEEIEEIRSALAVDPSRIFIMPEGISSQKILDALPSIMNVAARRGYGVSPRLHVLAFNNLRGV